MPITCRLLEGMDSVRAEQDVKEADDEQYLKRGRLAVLGVLRDLHRYEIPLMVSHERGQLISKMLYVDEEKIIFDLGSNDYDNLIVQEANAINIDADIMGARVEFMLEKLELDSYDAGPAFIASLPELLKKFQRREFFRISVPLEPTFWCHTHWPDGKAVRFRLQDLSLGGIAVLADKPLPESVSSGDTVKKMRVELGQYGQFELDAQLLHVGEYSSVNRKNETRTLPRLSFRFNNMNPVQERQLQQVIFALERLARDKANRFR